MDLNMEGNMGIVLNEKDILKLAIIDRRATQVKVAEKLGIAQHTLSANINRERISVDKFKTILDALDYDVCVVDRKTGETAYVVEV